MSVEQLQAGDAGDGVLRVGGGGALSSCASLYGAEARGYGGEWADGGSFVTEQQDSIVSLCHGSCHGAFAATK